MLEIHTLFKLRRISLKRRSHSSMNSVSCVLLFQMCGLLIESILNFVEIDLIQLVIKTIEFVEINCTNFVMTTELVLVS